MVVAEHTQNSTKIISLSGRFDIPSPKDYQTAMAKAEQAKPSRIVLDLTDLTFVDSSAIGLLHNSHTSLKAVGIQFCLANAQGYIKNVLNLFNMESIVPTFSSVDEACSALISA